MLLLWLHFAVSILCFAILKISIHIFRENIQQNGWKDWQKEKGSRTWKDWELFLHCLIPILNLQAVAAAYILIKKTPEEFEENRR